jgi:DNA excision repair protein ERCC-5
VHGVGIVNGMEIIHAFDVSQDNNNLTRFRQWLDGFDANDALKKKKDEKELTKEEAFHRKHRTARNRWEAPKHFPDPRVLSAYLNPVVDKSDTPFSWGVPDLDGLVSFCTRNIGWTPAETKALLKPVLKRIEETGSMRQTRLDTFMRYEDGIKFADVRSKRLREVLETVQGGDNAKSSKKKKTNGSNKKL